MGIYVCARCAATLELAQRERANDSQGRKAKWMIAIVASCLLSVITIIFIAGGGAALGKGLAVIGIIVFLSARRPLFGESHVLAARAAMMGIGLLCFVGGIALMITMGG